MRSAIALALAATVLLHHGPSRATTFKYGYQGYGLGIASPEITISHTAVSFSFQTDRRLSPLSTYHMVSTPDAAHPSSLLGWQVTDGTNAFSSLTGPFSGGAGGLFYGSFVSTDTAGRITSWQWIAQQVADLSIGRPGLVIESCGPDPCLSSIGVSDWYAGEYVQFNPPNGGRYLYSEISTKPGAWSVQQLVPEPPGLVSLLTAACAFFGLRIQRKSLHL